MKKALLIIITSIVILFFVSCQSQDEYSKSLLLDLSFDETSGNKVHDRSGNLEDATVQYVFSNSQFLPDNQDPQWKKSGVQNGALLFDGYSNFIRYSEDDIVIKGSSFSISAWVAPRAFEWDDPNGLENGNDKLTSIASQFNKSSNEGFILGYQRFGALSFQVGIGDRWISLYNTTDKLQKYEWNYVAATFDGSKGEMALYLNGEQIETKYFFEGSEITPAYDEPLLIGKNNEGSSNATASLNMMSGLMDEVKLYKSVLDDTYIRKTYSDIEVPDIPFEDIWLQNILTEDIYKTQYHGGPYQHWMNEPHAPFYYNGKYHLFFQFNMFGPYWRNIGWGHLVSDDMVNWKPLKEAIMPTENTVCPDGVWSGGATLDNDGNPVLFFTAGNDSYQKDGLISNQNIGIARPKDLSDPNLTEWIIDDELAIKQASGQGKTGEFRDASVWKEDDTYYMAVCSASTKATAGGTVLLYTTKDDSFHNWTYKGQVYEVLNQTSDLGTSWEMPILMPLSNKDKSITKYVLIISPAPASTADNDAYYYVGTLDKNTGRFTPDSDFKKPKLFDYGNNVFTGPSAFIDPVSNKVCIFSIMQDQRSPGDQAASGWAHSIGLTREIYLNEDGTDVYMTIHDNVESYENEVLLDLSNETVSSANQKLSSVKGDMLHIVAEIDALNASSFGIKIRKNNDILEETTIYCDVTKNIVGIKTGLSGTLSGKQNISGNFYGELKLINGKIKIDIYLDRSLVEAFFNDQKAVSGRIYPDTSSLGIQMYEEGGNIKINSLHIATMKSIYK